MPYRRYRFANMLATARASVSGSSMAIEVEASSFSVWNCVITVKLYVKRLLIFLQILLMSTILYGAGWSQEAAYDLEPSDPESPQHNHFRSVAFFFSVWALQSVALASLLIWAIGKKSYHLCHSWILCEILMQLFVCVCGLYFTYHYAVEDHTRSNDTWERPPATLSSSAATALPNSNEDGYPGMQSVHHYESSFRPPKHLAFLIILHFLIKAFGFWIVRRYMRLLAMGPPNSGNDVEGADANNSGNAETGGATGRNATRRLSPPPSYEGLGIDDLPCYDEALKLCLKTSMEDATPVITTATAVNDSSIDNNKMTLKSLVPTA